MKQLKTLMILTSIMIFGSFASSNLVTANYNKYIIATPNKIDSNTKKLHSSILLFKIRNKIKSIKNLSDSVKNQQVIISK